MSSLQITLPPRTTSAAAPSALAAARAWLRSSAIVDREGAVASWHNPRHPGFDYPEAAGLWLVACVGEDAAGDALAGRVGRRLADRMLAGAVGRDGVAYTFDQGVALAGLHALRDAGGHDHWAARSRGEAALLDALARRRATDRPCPARWSTRYGPHLLKLTAALARLPRASAEPAAARLFDDLADLHDGGRYLTEPNGDFTYVHAHCYAAEGLWCVALGGDRSRASAARDHLRRAADWLADVQLPDGGLPRHHDGARGSGPVRCDATAQAIRIWALCAPRRHAAAIARARALLSTCVTAEGAVRYEPGSDDLNTWATVFTLQATRLAVRTPQPVRPW